MKANHAFPMIAFFIVSMLVTAAITEKVTRANYVVWKEGHARYEKECADHGGWLKANPWNGTETCFNGQDFFVPTTGFILS